MAKSKKNYFITVIPFPRFLAMVLFVLFPILGFYLGSHIERFNQPTNQTTQINENIKQLSQPAKLVEEFYSQYVSCLDKNYGSTKTISGD